MKTTTRNYLMLAAAFSGLVGVVLFSRWRSHSMAGQLPGIEVIGGGVPIVVQFGAHWCPPCRKQLPIMAALSKEGHAFQVAFVDVDENPQAARRYDIDPIPTLIFFGRNGKELYRHTGFWSQEAILAKWEELGVKTLAAQ